MTQTRWSTIEKEAFGIQYALQWLDHYLHNTEFIIKTDHKPLKYLLEAPMQNKKIQLWALSIAGYNCKIEYIEGKANICADLLSRPIDSYGPISENIDVQPDVSNNTLEIGAMDSNQFYPESFASYNLKEKDHEDHEKECLGYNMVLEQGRDTEIAKIKKLLSQNDAPNSVAKHHLVLQERVYYISSPDDQPTLRLFVPQNIRDEVLLQFHDCNGHMGMDKTFDTMRSKYYWPNMYKEVTEYLSKCITCQKRGLKAQKAPLQKTDFPPMHLQK